MTSGDRFIEAARELVPSLLARAQKAEAENERLTGIDWAQRQDWLTASTAAITAERDMLKRGGAELGRIVERQCNWVVDATHSQDVIGEDGDGDWEIVWERLFGMAAERDALAARLASAEAKLRDFAEHGLRADLTPTVMFGDESHVYRQLTDYLRRLDRNVRKRAVDTTPEPTDER